MDAADAFDKRTRGVPLLSGALPFAKQAGREGLKQIGSALENFEMYVQQGPDGIRFLSFFGGILVTVYGLSCAINIFQIVSNPVEYIVDSSQLLFGFITVVLESSPSIIASYSRVASLQKTINDNCKFLTLLWGRGAFYLYIGAHVILISGLLSCGGILGMYMGLMGVFYLAWYQGYDVSRTTGCIIDYMRECLGWARSRFSGAEEKMEPGYIRIEE